MKKSYFFNKRTSRRFHAVVLCAVMMFSLAACGGKGETDKDAGVEGFAYVPEYISVGTDTENTGYNRLFLAGDKLYYISYNIGVTSSEEENTQNSMVLNSQSLEDGSTSTIEVPLEENQNVQEYAVGNDGSIFAILNSYDAEPDSEGNYKSTSLLSKFDAQGNNVFSVDISDQLNDEYGNQGYVSDLAIDGEGNSFLCLSEKIVLLGAAGEKQGTIDVSSGWINGICRGKDGKVYVAYYDYASNSAGALFAEVLGKEQKLGSPMTNFPSGGNGGIASLSETVFLSSDGSKVYEYDMEKQKSSELFSWLDCNINGSYVDYLGVSDNGQIVAVMRDWNSGEMEIAKINKVDKSELVQKEEIVLGTLYESQQLQSAVVSFNKSSDKYQVKLKTYIDTNSGTENSYNDAITALNNDITSGSNCPDIMDLSQMNEDQVVSKGVFEDLNSYLEKSDVLKKEDFFENILDSYTHDGKLYSIPASFSLSTIVGKKSVVGDEMGWTLDDMIKLSQEHPDAKIFGNVDKNTALFTCLAYNLDYFIDWEKAECNFDNDEFKKILEFVNMFPDEIEWETYSMSDIVEEQQSGKILLGTVNIYDFNEVQVSLAQFGGEVTFIGFPTMDGSIGCNMNTDSRYAISSKSEQKEGAWEFIEHYLMNASSDSMFFWGFSTKKAEFQKQMDAAIKVDYLLDENGEPVMDENGEAVVASGMSSMSMDGWEYTYHQTTEEEAQQVMKLVEVASPGIQSNDSITTIINEEAAPYFQGQKSVDEVVKIIQGRVQMYVSENS